MKTINLRYCYPIYTFDFFIDVPNELATILHEFELREAAYRLRRLLMMQDNILGELNYEI